MQIKCHVGSINHIHAAAIIRSIPGAICQVQRSSGLRLMISCQSIYLSLCLSLSACSLFVSLSLYTSLSHQTLPFPNLFLILVLAPLFWLYKLSIMHPWQQSQKHKPGHPSAPCIPYNTASLRDAGLASGHLPLSACAVSLFV